MTPSIQSVAASLTEKAASDLIGLALATPAERAKWTGGFDTRPMLEQLVECCLANRMWARILPRHEHSLLPKGMAEQAYQELDSLEKVTTCLKETSDELAQVIRAIPDGDLGIIVPFPDKPEAGKSLAECLFHAYWNMVYHQGQVCYIQTMYGDWEEHCDAGPFGETGPEGQAVG